MMMFAKKHALRRLDLSRSLEIWPKIGRRLHLVVLALQMLLKTLLGVSSNLHQK